MFWFGGLHSSLKEYIFPSIWSRQRRLVDTTKIRIFAGLDECAMGVLAKCFSGFVCCLLYDVIKFLSIDSDHEDMT